jgi:outer membrane protein TolC
VAVAETRQGIIVGIAQRREHGRAIACLGLVADALPLLQARGAAAEIEEVPASAGEAAALSCERHAAGTSTLIDLLDKQRAQNDANQSLSAAITELTGDFVAIQKALGLGWAFAVAGTATR